MGQRSREHLRFFQPMPNVDRACPLCASPDYELLLELSARDFCETNSTYASDYAAILGISAETRFPLVQCARCRFVFAGQAPSSEFLRTVYETVINADTAVIESQSALWVAHQLELASRTLTALRNAPVPIRLLDYGCGYGTILRAIRGPQVQAFGYEPSASPRLYCATRDLKVFETEQEVLDQAPYDAIILSDVLEHVTEPRATLATCARIMSKGAILCVSVPDFNKARMLTVIRDHRAGRPIPREVNLWEHLNYFSPADLQRTLQMAGFEPIVDRKPDFGLRVDVSGIRRLGNIVKSVRRMLQYAFNQRPLSTTILAERR